MSAFVRTACCLAALAAYGISPANAQAELAWHVDSSMAQTDDPAAAIRFEADGTIVTAGKYAPISGANSSTLLYLRSPDGSAVATTTWPGLPSGIYAWNDAAIGSGGEIALCGRAPTSGLIGLASRTGTLLWTPQILPATYVQARSVTFDPSSGDLLATGDTSNSKVFLVRYSNQGTLLASRIWQHPANGDDFGLEIALDGQGDVFVLGFADTAGNARVFVLKLDSAFNVVWERERYTLVGGGDLTLGPALLVDGAGHVLVACGCTVSSPTEVFTLWKLDANGNTLWAAEATDATNPSGAAYCVALDPFGNAVVAGHWSSASGGALVRSYAPDGTLLWSRSAGTSIDRYTSCAVDSGGDVIVAGLTGWTPESVVRRFDRDGNERWTYAESNQTLRNGVGAAPDGGALVGSSFKDVATGSSFLHDYRLSSDVFPVCAGDGSVAPCPCANDSAPSDRSGCLHSLGTGGHLDATGQSYLSQDTLVLFGSSMPSTPVIYFQGDLEVAPVVFGDGLRCAGGSLHRLAVLFNVSGDSQFPGPGDPPLSVAGGVGSPGLRMYQAYFRDSAVFCTAATFNATNAVRVHWLP